MSSPHTRTPRTIHVSLIKNRFPMACEKVPPRAPPKKIVPITVKNDIAVDSFDGNLTSATCPFSSRFSSGPSLNKHDNNTEEN